jgi:hypothetical protein
MRSLFKRSRIAPTILVLWAGFCAWVFGGWLSVHGIQEQPFTVLERRDGYDVREYSEGLYAQVGTTGSWADAHTRGAALLSAYIGGANTTQESVAQMRSADAKPEGTGIAGAAPMLTARKSGVWLISYALPLEWTLVTLPRPSDPRVRIVQEPARTVAVLSFPGTMSQEDAVVREQYLRDLLARDGAVVLGTATIGQYYTSSTPSFLRRNEIIIPIR